MVDRPMIFSAPMIRALREGRKTQTRRVFVPPAPFAPHDDISVELATGSIKPKYAAGDHLWVRENFSIYLYEPGCWYWADGRVAEFDATRPKPSIHMPRWASRITLTVTDVRVHRLLDISEEDAKAEGAPYEDGQDFPVQKSPLGATFIEDGWDCPKDWYADLWDSLHGEGA